MQLSTLLAQLISGHVSGGSIDEVLFTDIWAQHGLALYLDAEIQGRASEPCTELSEPGRLVIATLVGHLAQVYRLDARLWPLYPAQDTQLQR